MASETPERVERLVLCCTSAQPGPPEQWETRARTVRAEGVSAIYGATLERWFTPAFHSEHPEVIEWGERMLLGTPAEGYASCYEAIRDMDMRDRLGSIRAPTLVISGTDDPATPPKHGELIRDSIPQRAARDLPPDTAAGERWAA